MLRNCPFDEIRDIESVVKGLDVNLELALSQGVIENTSDGAAYNDIADPSMIGGRVEDIFQAMDRQRGLSAAAAKAQATDSQAE